MSVKTAQWHAGLGRRSTRRELLIALGASALIVSVRAAEEPPRKIPRVGIVWINSLSDVSRYQEAFLGGLRGVGYVEGNNIVVEVRYAEGKIDRLPMLVAELLRSDVDVIVAPSSAAALAAKAATNRVPIVIANVADPESIGLVASLRRPDGNVTGLSNLASDLSGKYLELLKQALPGLTRVAVLWDPSSANVFRARLESAARELGLQLHSIDVQATGDIENVFRLAARSRDVQSSSLAQVKQPPCLPQPNDLSLRLRSSIRCQRCSATPPMSSAEP